jgi:phosphoribosylformylglycinamidine synthase
MATPEFCVLKTDGINCEEETQYALQLAGAKAEIVHVNQLRGKDRNLRDYDGLLIPGGFSYGDDIASGKVLAVELTSYLSDQLQEFVDQKKPIMGICNGFQVLTRTGLLPNRTLGEQSATLARNESGKFECRWIELAVGRSVCKFIKPSDFESQPIPMQVAHGEGRYFARDLGIRNLIDDEQVVFRYANPDMQGLVDYPDNPNGSIENIAGVCDPTGLILGMMPHPERSVVSFHPNRARTAMARRAARTIFSNIVEYAKEM